MARPKPARNGRSAARREPMSSTDLTKWAQVGTLVGAILVAVAGGAMQVTSSASRETAELTGRLDELRRHLDRIEARLVSIERKQ